MRKRLRLLLAAGLAATAASATALPAAAAPSSSSWTAGLTNLVMTKSATTWTNTPGRQVTLQCEPTGGTHPTPQAACDSLLAVNGNFAKLPHIFAACPDYWDPVTVTVTGTWRTQPVTYSQTYSNDCAAGVLSDNVFRF